MKSIQIWGDDVQQVETIGGNRRDDRRYELQLQLRWKLIRRRKVVAAGTGSTLDISSGGIRFEAGRELPDGLDAELTIAWPMLLQNVAPMHLVVTGRIVRSSEGWAAIRTVTHEFRTSGIPADRRVFPAHLARTPGMLIQMDTAVAIGGIQ